ncbi:polysaccharide deacetylase [Desulfofarcimen acetoxidans DSM 771]|uniref:Polysaccharide deacetylase n=1 Tax=Desulfofarcimen acetoxidans (strain ATCC 49208 / DSM 771 / KCTC 5769 / VKM B-1644 / 5575) TaxID=485916 RepID=C8W3L6_DESAS|nr:polysaccharide deacetylase family protein [Desulfofarcimen acetoxidans]ACV63802.1 polysaccharide deacetylase [Desulfofarcimen acetoxidans DSM 771]
MKKRFLAMALLAVLVLSGGAIWHYCHSDIIPIETGIKVMKGVPVLMYHKVNPDSGAGGFGLRVTPENFDWQMHYLKKNGYRSISLGDMLDSFQHKKALPKKPVIITFDDGYQDNYRYAYPILKKYNYTATIFVVAGLIGKTNEFDVKKHLQPENKMMDWSEIISLDNAGITIGSHTLTHPHLTGLSDAEARQEIMVSKKVLEAKLGREVQFFCYPYGEYNESMVRLVKEAGYRAATTTKQGLNYQNTDAYLLKRIRIMGKYNHEKFIEELHKWDYTGESKEL